MILMRLSPRTQFLILALHVAALAGGCAFTWSQWATVDARKTEVGQAADALLQLDTRLAAAARRRAEIGATPNLDTLIEAPSATVAGASLQGRVVSTVRDAGGSVTSSQIDLTGSGAVPPAVTLNVNFQIPNAALQALLYNLESRKPAMFLDQISIESEMPETGGDGSPGAELLKVSLTVSAFWTAQSKS